MALADHNDPTRTSPDLKPKFDETAEPGPTQDQAPNPPAPRKPAPLQIRDQARYVVIAEHGRGGLGRVLRAHDRELGRPLAIKELLNRDGISELRFFREAMITARLEHPGIVPVHEAGRWPDGTPFYAMKLVAGRSLRERIESAGDATARLALLPHVVAIADAVAYAHSRRIIHRDLKPANVIIGDYGETIVIDWGLAKNLSDDTQETAEPTTTQRGLGELTVAGSFLGTPAFMAPEQAFGRSSRASDIYSLGAIVFNVVTAKVPSPGGQSLPEIAAASKVAKDLVAIIARATAHDHEQRYSTASDVAADLRRFLRGEPVHARRYSTVAKAYLRVARNPLVYGTLLAAALVVTLVSAIAVVVVIGQRERARSSEIEAHEAKQLSASRLTEVTRAHIVTLLQADPTRAAALIANHADGIEASLFRAEAEARGIATREWRAHSGPILLLARTRAGSVLSAGGDFAIRVFDRDATPRTVTATMSRTAYPAFSATANKVVFVEAPSSVVVADPDTGDRVEFALKAAEVPDSVEIGADGVVAVAFRDGSSAVLDKGGLTKVDVDGKLLFASTAHLITMLGQRVTVTSRHDRSVVGTVSVPSRVTSSAVADDGTLVAVGTADGALAVLSITSAKVRLHQVCSSRIDAVQIGNTGAIGYACNDRTAGVVGTGYGHEKIPADAMAWALATSDDRRFFVAGTDVGTVYVRDLASGFKQELRGHAARIINVTAPSDSGDFLTGDGNGFVRHWHVPTWPSRYIARSGEQAYVSAFSIDGTRLAVAGQSGTIRLWNLQTGACQMLPGHTKPVIGIIARPGAPFFASLSLDGTARAWSFETGSPIDVAHSDSEPFTDIDFAFNATTIVASSPNGHLVEWHPLERIKTTFHNTPSAIGFVEGFADHPNLATAARDGSMALISRSGVRTLVSGSEGAATKAMKARRTVVAFGSHTGRIGVVRVSDGMLSPVASLGDSVRSVTLSPDERYVAATTESQLALFSLVPPPGPVFVLRDVAAALVVFDWRSETLAAAGMFGEVRLYSLKHRAWRVLRLHTGQVLSLYFSRDNNWLVSTDAHGAIAITDVSQLFEPSIKTRALPALEPTCTESRHEEEQHTTHD